MLLYNPNLHLLRTVTKLHGWYVIYVQRPMPICPTTPSNHKLPQTLYEFPNIAYRDSEDFKGISTKSVPSKELIETIYKNTRYDVRFYEQVQLVSGEKQDTTKTSDPGKFIISAALQPPRDASSAADLDAWYREEHIPMLARAPGFVRSRRFELANASVLEDFQWSDAMETAPRYLALHEFGGDALPWKELQESAQTEWAKKVMGGLAKEEVGWYEVRRVYSESEWGHVGK
jgi:hypothetical protein